MGHIRYTSCSVIDQGGLERLGLHSRILETHHDLVDASGNGMSIKGSVGLQIAVKDHLIHQNMKMLNSKSYRNMILGRTNERTNELRISILDETLQLLD